jgi:hypothetical protein
VALIFFLFFFYKWDDISQKQPRRTTFHSASTSIASGAFSLFGLFVQNGNQLHPVSAVCEKLSSASVSHLRDTFLVSLGGTRDLPTENKSFVIAFFFILQVPGAKLLQAHAIFRSTYFNLLY